MAVYPGAKATDSTLYIAKNSLATTLNGAVNNSVTTIPVASTTGFPAVGFISIDNEIISYTGTTGTTFTGCTRGADGTSAASHTDASPVNHNVIAAHHNAVKDEVIAIENDIEDAFGAVTPASPNATDTSLLNRMKSILYQIKAIAGTTNWHDAIAVSLVNKLSLAGGTMSGAIAMGTSKITGLGNGSSAQDAAAYTQVKVLQVIQSTTSTSTSTTSTSFVDTNSSVTITPSSSSNKVLLIAVGTLTHNANGFSGCATLANGTTNLLGTNGQAEVYVDSGATHTSPACLLYLDSPATTSAITYKVRIKTLSGNGTTYWIGNNVQFAAIVAIEINGV